MASSGYYSIPSEQTSQARAALLAQYQSRLAEESLRHSRGPIIDVQAQGSTRKQEPATTVTLTATPSTGESQTSDLNPRPSP